MWGESGRRWRNLPGRYHPYPKIREEEAYEGVRVLFEARLANARIPLQIDVGFGDVITPAPVEIEYPTLLAFPTAKMRAYPKESVVAEKFEALIKLGMANSRMKDFYDLWVMAGRFEFRGSVLAEAHAATFHGEKDFAAKEEDLLPFYSQLNTHDKRYILLPDGGHMLILEKGHRRFQRDVLSFFDRP